MHKKHKGRIFSFVVVLALLLCSVFVPAIVGAAEISSKNNNATLAVYSADDQAPISDKELSVGENLIYKNKSGKISYYKTEGGEEVFATEEQNKQLLPLGDGNINDKSHNDISVTGAVQYNFIWCLTNGNDTATATINEVWFIHRSQVGNWGFRVNKYEIRVANTISELSLDDALVATVEGITDGEQYNKITFANAVSGRYISIRCLKLGGDKTARIGQIAVFGKTEPGCPRGVSYTFAEAENVYNEDLAASESNLLKGNASGKITYTKQNGREYSATTTQNEMLLNLTDGAMADKLWHDINIADAKSYSFTWDLIDGNSAWKSGEVSDIWIRWNSQERERTHRVSFFDVYAANSLEDLCKESSKVASFEHITATESCHRIMFDTPLTTRYIRIVPLRMTGDTCVRVNEISVIGNLISALTYSEYNDGVKVIGYTGKQDVTNIKIPNEVNGKKVIAIGDGALVGASNLQTLYIPETVTEISEISLPDSVNTISGGWHSKAQEYANQKGILFEPDVYDFAQDHTKALLSEGENILNGAGAVAYRYFNGEYKAVASELTSINDNNVESTYGDSRNFPYYNEENETFNEMYADFVFDTGGMNELESFVYVGHNFTELRTAEYQIYISEDSDTENLFKLENLLINFKNTRNSKRQIYTLKQKIKARLVGLRIIKPAMEEAGADYAIRVRDFAAYGTKADDKLAEFVSDNLLNLPKELGKNLLNNKLDVYSRYNVGYSTQNTFIKGTAKLLDGSLSTFAEAPNASLSTQNSSYDLAYDLGSAAKISAIFLGNYVEKDLRARKIEIYAANDLESLYSQQSKIESYDNDNGYRRLIWQFKDSVNCQFIGLRIYSLVNANEAVSYPRFSELGVYGKYKDSKYKVTSRTELIFGDFKNSQIDKISKAEPINVNTVPAAIRLNDTRLDKAKNTGVITDKKLHPKTDLERLSFENGVELGTIDGSSYVDVVWGYEKYYEFQKFMHYGSDSNIEGPYHTGWYQVFVGENIYDVTNSENMVYEYRYDRQGKSNGQIVDLIKADGTYPIGKCVAVRILNPVSTEDYTVSYIGCRIAEMLVWGKETERVNKPVNLAKDVIYTAKLLDGEDIELSKEQIEALYDGAYSKNGILQDARSSAQIMSGGKQLVININLCSNMQINSVLLKLKQDVGYKIYGALKEIDIDNNATLLFEHTLGSATQKKFSKLKTVRYIKIIFEPSENVVIDEFSVIGSDEQQRNYHNIMRQSAVVLTEYILSADGEKTNVVNSNTEVWARLNDQEDYKTTVLEGGNQLNGDTLNLMVDFCSLKAIDRVKINYLAKAMIYWPYKVNYYVGTDYETVQKETKPSFTAEGLPADELGDIESPEEIFHDVTFQKQYARYVRIEFVSTNKNTDYFKQMVVAVNEVRAFGIDVDGTASGDKENRVFSYTDKKYGVTVDVVSMNEADIYEELSYAKITRKKLTSAQEEMLEGEGFEANDGYYYSVAFYNLQGERINDVGRDIQVKFNCGKNIEDYTLFYAPSSQEAYTLLSSEYGKTKIMSYVYALEMTPGVYNFGLAKYTQSQETGNSDTPDDYYEEDFSELQDITDGGESSDEETLEESIVKDESSEEKPVQSNKEEIKTKSEKYNPLWIILPIIFVLICGAVVFFIVRNKRNVK